MEPTTRAGVTRVVARLLRDGVPVGQLIVAALGMLAVAAVEHESQRTESDETSVRLEPAPTEGHFRVSVSNLRPECVHVARLSVIRLGGSWSPRYGPMCADTRRGMWGVKAYFEARATGCLDVLSDEAFSVPRWLSTGADVESAFCIGELTWNDPNEFLATLARAYELARGFEPLTYAGPIEATAIRRFVIDRVPDKIDACVAYAWRGGAVADLDVDIRLTLTPDRTVATGSSVERSVADCLALIIGGVHFDPVVRDTSLDIPFRVHAIDPKQQPSVELGRRQSSDPTLDRAIESDLEYTLWRLRDCYARALRIGDTAMHEGDAVLTFDLSSTGLAAPRATGLDPVLDTCIADAVTQRNFYRSQLPVHVRQELRFSLRPAPTEGP